MDISIHNVTDISVETFRRNSTTWADIKIKWRSPFGGKAGEETVTLYFNGEASELANDLAKAFPQMEEA